VATDIAARGIDVSNIECVINYDLPDNAEDYVHRIGRTGRAGKSGHAISFAAPDQSSAMRDIERLIESPVEVSEQSSHQFDARAGGSSRGRGGRSGGGRPSSGGSSRGGYSGDRAPRPAASGRSFSGAGASSSRSGFSGARGGSGGAGRRTPSAR